MQHTDDLCLAKEAMDGGRLVPPAVRQILAPYLHGVDRLGHDELGCLARPEGLLKSWRHAGPLAVGAPWLKQSPVYPLF